MEELVSPSCLEARNNEGLRPRELLSKEHKSLFEYSETWMKNTADSFLLMATIFLTVVFGAAFSIPGGYDQDSGEPVLVGDKMFQMFLCMEVFAVLGSLLSTMLFRSVLASTFAEDDFGSKLPLKLMLGFMALHSALVFTVIAFMISISLGNSIMKGFSIFGGVIVYLALPFWYSTELSAKMNSMKPLTKDCIKRR